MSLIIEGGRIPPRWEQRVKSHPVNPNASVVGHPDAIRVALVNNMPDPALEDTEMQFFELLDVASGSTPVTAQLYSLPGLARGESGLQHLKNFYFDFNELWNSKVDGVIITGTEPREPKLRDEHYWPLLAQLFDWAERSTTSTVLSCLAAHASVLHSGRVSRHRLPDKQFGVFKSLKTCNHALLNGTASALHFPHSRWNEVREDELVAAGYTVLTKSAEAGVDLFVIKNKRSLFVHFQGHPEYGVQTLMKEYRRDIKRFLRHERETYPTMPFGYFDAEATSLLKDFHDTALADRREEMATSFPDTVVARKLQNTWHSIAVRVYHNWVRYLESNKENVSSLLAMTRAARTRSASADAEIA